MLCQSGRGGFALGLNGAATEQPGICAKYYVAFLVPQELSPCSNMEKTPVTGSQIRGDRIATHEERIRLQDCLSLDLAPLVGC